MPGVDVLIEEIAAVSRSRTGAKRLAAMLRQDAPHFRGLSAGDTERLRAHILASFEHRPLPAPAVRAVKEDLRTSQSPIVLAGAARAARALVRVEPEWRDLLAAASARIEARDEVVRLDNKDVSADTPLRTARDEIALTLALRDEEAGHCCSSVPAAPTDQPLAVVTLCPKALRRVTVEDQAGRPQALFDLLQGRVSLVAFFYTRCMNPLKCSLTVARLGALARVAAIHPAAADLGVFAISYDSDFDSAQRLLTFGRDRGFPFGERARLLRCDAGWDTLRRMFALQVGYTATTVNGHARELFVVSGRLEATTIDCERLLEPIHLLDSVSALSAAAVELK